MSQYSPLKPCASPNCESVSGEFRFAAPATIYSFNADRAYQVYKIEEGVYYPYGVFGGALPFERRFDIAGEYVIRWALQPAMPDCIAKAPAFRRAMTEQAAYPVMVCLKPTSGDEPTFKAWAYACGQCNTDVLDVHLFSIDGKNRLNPADYTIS